MNDPQQPAATALPAHPGLFRWLPFWFFIFLALGIGAIGYFTFQQYQANAQQGEMKQLSTIAGLKVEGIAKWRAERRGDAEIFMRGPFLTRAVEKWLREGAPPGETRQMLLERMKATQGAYNYREIFLLDTQGKAVLSTSPEIPPPGSYSLELVQDAIRDQAVVFLDIGSREEPQGMAVIAPLLIAHDGKPRTVGAVYLRIDPSQYLFPLLKATPSAHKSLEVVLMRREESEVVFLNVPATDGGTGLLRQPLGKSKLPAAMAVAGKEGEAEGLDYRGLPVFAELRKVPDSGWFLVAKVEQEEIYAPLRKLAWLVAGAIAILLALTGVAMSLWWRNQRARLLLEERLRSEKSLQTISAYTRSLIEASLDPLVTISAAGKIMDVNEAAVRITGVPREQLTGSDFSAYFTEPDKAQAGYQEVFAKGSVNDYPLAIRHVSGKVTEVLYNASVYRDEKGEVAGVFAAARDVTERKKMEESLRRNEAQLNEAQRIGRIGGWEWDAINDTIWWSDEYFRISGFDPGKPTPSYAEHLKAYTPESAGRLDAAVKRAVETGEPYELDLERVTGGWITAHGEAKRDASGKITGLKGTAQDITERKLAERNILHLNRLYGILSRTNKMIVRAQDRQTLFAEACRIAVEQGSFRMSWVGLADAATRLIKPVAMHGHFGDYLKNIRISMDDIPEGRGPTGTAFREGRHVICRDIEHEPYMAPWREAALAMGYRSSAAFPLWTDGAVLGVFTVYAPEADWFNDDETRLLDELASDISYALAVLEKENLRKHAEEEIRRLNAELEQRVAERTAQLEAANKQFWRQNAVLGTINEVFRGAIVCQSEEELAKTCLAVAEKLSGSKFGFMGEINDKGLFDTIAISDPGWSACKIPNGQAVLVIRDMPIRGVDRSVLREGEPRIVNGEDVIGSHPDHVGVPAGHPTLTAFLGVPLKQSGKTIGMIGLGNREGGYTPAVQEDVEALAVAIVEAIKRKRAEILVQHINEELRKKNSELLSATEELESFAYSVSHDLRVPLRAIDGFSRLVLKQYEEKLDAEGRRLLNVIRDNTKRMGQLIEDILAFSRAGRLEIKAEEADMEALAQEAWEELGPARAGREIRLDIQPLPKVSGDPAMLRQVWANLLGNAVKFTKTKAVGQIGVEGKTEGAECVYSIRDNGVGFDQQYADKLFGVFQRLHGIEEFEGTGIGLAIVKRIVTRHGGRVWAEGKVNEGATVYFALPSSY